MKMLLPLIFVVLSIIGLADSGYITYQESRDIVPPCNVSGFDCESVLSSDWATIGPIPISALGLIYYSVVFLLAVMMVLEIDLSKFGKKIPAFKFLSAFDLLLLVSGFGLLFSIYLMVIMGLIIKAWCLYCVISATNSLILFVLTRVFQQQIATKSLQHTYFFTHLAQSNLIKWLYQKCLKPIFFQFDAEVVHVTITNLGATLGTNPISQFLTRTLFFFQHPNNAVEIDGIKFPAKVGLAAGFDYHAQLSQVLPDLGFGFHSIGTVTYHPYQGNARPRLGRYPNSKGLLVNKGFKSLGAVATIDRLTCLKFRIPVGISIGSTNKEFSGAKTQIKDILTTFALFEKSAVQHRYYELNISCPNTKGGEPFTTSERLELLLKSLAKLNISKPIYVKMPIDISDDQALVLLKIINSHRLAGVIFGNLTKDKANPALTPTDKKHWLTAAGHVSGKPTWEKSNHLIKLTRKYYPKMTIIGTGGIFTPEDAQEKLKLGANLVQLITGMIFEGPQLIGQINNLDAKLTK